MDEQCVALQKRLSADGLRSCILKGQGVASLYSEHLRGLRQSGDIDRWIDGSPEDTIARLKNVGIELSNINIKHVEAKVFEDTEVEIHFLPSWFYNPVTNKRFKPWIKASSDEQMRHENCGLVVPTAEFNVVYLLLHIYRHLLDEGVGMRQLMDYFFALKALPSSQKERCYETICNFGHHDERIDHEHRGAFGRGWVNFCRNMRFVSRYPGEVLCAPFWKLWHWGLRKRFN